MHTIFNRRPPIRPMMVGVTRQANKVTFIPLYIKKSGKSIYNIEKDLEKLNGLLTADDVVINNLKEHIIAFKVSSPDNINAHELSWSSTADNISVDEAKKAVSNELQRMRETKLQKWHKIRANASKVYSHLENKGIFYNYTIAKPRWHNDTFSGRSRTTGFNIQGANEKDVISNINNDGIFINFDWVAADMRIVAHQSDDKLLLESFNNSDPYTYLLGILNDGSDQVTRNEVKRILLSTIYSMNLSSHVLDLFGDLKKWMSDCRGMIKKDGCLRSMLGRKFEVGGERSQLSVFNAIIQGSVAHAMQNALYRVWQVFPDNILTENHDSLVMTCSDTKQLSKIISKVSEIMVRPFDGILCSEDIRFPITISVGKRYKQWRFYKRMQ